MDTNTINEGKRDEIIKKFLLKINMLTESARVSYFIKKSNSKSIIYAAYNLSIILNQSLFIEVVHAENKN